jgi:hypothetical protein
LSSPRWDRVVPTCLLLGRMGDREVSTCPLLDGMRRCLLSFVGLDKFLLSLSVLSGTRLYLLTSWCLLFLSKVGWLASCLSHLVGKMPTYPFKRY